MWEDYEKRNRTVKIILAIIAVILAAALIFAIKIVSEDASAQEAELQTASTVNQEAQAAAKAETLERINADYQQDMDVVAQYIPGVVCWGDKITAGSAGGVSYPKVLEDLIKENICDLYDFRSTLDYTDNVSRVTWADYRVEIPVVNLGTGEETSTTILGRNGAVPYVVTQDLTIPAGTEPVEVKFSSANGRTVEPLTESDGGVNPVTIAGVTGTLSLDENSYRSNSLKYYFTRLEPGTEITVAAGTEIITAASEKYRDYIAIVFIGNYGEYSNVDDLISQQRAIIDHQLNTDRYLVIGTYNVEGYWDGGYTEIFEQYEAAMMKAFGEHFVNIRKYLVSDGMEDAELKATDTDTYELKNGRIPDSLRSSSGSLELSATAYKLVGQVIYDKMDQLGYFDEVVEELGIDTVREEIRLGLRDENGVTITNS